MTIHDSLSTLEARLVEVRAAITKARKAQSYAAGLGQSVQRGLLKTLLDEEQWLLSQIAALDAETPSGAGASFINKVKFERPL